MDKTSIGVLREAEDQTNLKLELQMEVKRLNAQIMAVIRSVVVIRETRDDFDVNNNNNNQVRERIEKKETKKKIR